MFLSRHSGPAIGRFRVAGRISKEWKVKKKGKLSLSLDTTPRPDSDEIKSMTGSIAGISTPAVSQRWSYGVAEQHAGEIEYLLSSFLPSLLLFPPFILRHSDVFL